jgi:hypothetical protein
MDCYISENSDLKKRLEELASQNKSLLDQLKTLKATLENQPTAPNANNSIILPSGDTTATNSNQFGTLLMVLILFFAVVLGVWSPVFTKDQMTRHLSATSTMTNAASVAVAATTNVVSSNISQRIQTNSISSSAAAVTAVCAAASAIASTFNVKTESPDNLSNTHQDEMPPSLIFHQSQFGNKDLESPLISFEGNGELVKLFPKADNGEQSAIEANSHMINNVILNSHNTLVRSKTGTAVEITKVRPFIGKASTLAKTVAINGLKPNSLLTLPTTPQHHYQTPVLANNTNQEDMPLSNDDAQILVLGVSATNSNELKSPPSSSSSSTCFNALSSKISQKININSNDNKLGGNYRVINTNTIGGFTNGSSASPCSSTKLTTRFRVINSNQSGGYSNPSIIKLSAPS